MGHDTSQLIFPGFWLVELHVYHNQTSQSVREWGEQAEKELTAQIQILWLQLVTGPNTQAGEDF